MTNLYSLVNNNIRFINIAAIILILLFPSNIHFFFDGLPLNNKVEIIFILIVLPFVYFFNKELLVNKKLLFFLSIFLIFKIITNYSFSNQKLFSDIKIIDEKNYPKLNLFQKNPETFWNNHTVEIYKNFNNKSDFFMSWGNRFDNERKKNIDINLELYGQIRIKSNEIFQIKTNGILIENFNFIKKNKNNIYEYKNLSSEHKYLDLSSYVFEFKNKEKWFLKFELNNKGKKIDPFIYKRFVQVKHFNNNPSILNISFYINIIFESAFIIFFIIFFYKILRKYKINAFKKFDDIILIVNSLGTLIFYLILKFNVITDATYLSPIGFYLIFQFLIINFYKKLIIKENENTNKEISKSLYLYILLPIAIYFITILYGKFSNITYFPIVARNADDWSFDLWIARYILLENDLGITKPCLRTAIQQSENFLISKNLFFKDVKDVCLNVDKSFLIYQNQYFYRFYAALMFLVFGFNYFSFITINIYLCLLIALVSINILKRLNTSSNLQYFFFIIYFVCLTVGSFRYILLRPSSEILASGIIFISIYFFYKFSEDRYFKYFIISCFFATIAGLTRINLLIVIGSIVIFSFKDTDIKNIFYFKNFLKFFKKNFKIIFFYSIFVISPIIIILTRNYLITGNYNLPNPNSDQSFYEHLKIIPYWLYEIFAATNWPSKPNFTFVVLTIGSILPFLLALRNKLFLYKNFKIIFVLFFTIFSYFLYTAGAYPPRFSMHLLPLSALGLVLSINNFKIRKLFFL